MLGALLLSREVTRQRWACLDSSRQPVPIGARVVGFGPLRSRRRIKGHLARQSAGELWELVENVWIFVAGHGHLLLEAAVAAPHLFAGQPRDENLLGPLAQACPPVDQPT